MLRFDCDPLAAELCNEGVRVSGISKTEPSIFRDFKHAASIWRMTVPPRLAKFVHLAETITESGDRWDSDRDLVRIVAINLRFGDFAFAPGHHCQEVTRRVARWTADRQRAPTHGLLHFAINRDTRRIAKRRWRLVVNLRNVVGHVDVADRETSLRRRWQNLGNTASTTFILR